MESKKIRLSVVIPTFNESQKLIQNLELIKFYLLKEGYEFEIIVSDNGSTDKTALLAKDYAKKNKFVKVLESPLPGKGPAVRNVVLGASNDYILVCDADLAAPIKELKRLFVWILEQGYDIAIASREGMGAFRKGEPYIRHLMGRIFNAVVQTIAIKGYNDTQCGFKLFKTAVAKNIFEKLLVYKDFKRTKKPYLGAFDVEVLVIANLLGYRVKEIPITWTYVPTKRISHLKDSLKMVRDVIKIKINAVRGEYR